MFDFNMTSPAKDNSHRLSSIADIGLLCVLIFITAIRFFSRLFSWKAPAPDPTTAPAPTTASAPAPIAEDVVEKVSRPIRRYTERVKAKEARALARIKALVKLKVPITMEARRKLIRKNLKIEQDLIELACLKAAIIEICHRKR